MVGEKQARDEELRMVISFYMAIKRKKTLPGVEQLVKGLFDSHSGWQSAKETALSW